MGGGVPLSVLAGSAKLMDLIADGTVVHAGTLNGNPLCLAAAKAVVDELSKDAGSVFERLWVRGEKLRQGIEATLRAAGLDVVTSGGGPVFQVSFMDAPPKRYRDTLSADVSLQSDFVLALLDEGILALPDGRWYLSTAHSDDDVDETLRAVERTISA